MLQNFSTMISISMIARSWFAQKNHEGSLSSYLFFYIISNLFSHLFISNYFSQQDENLSKNETKAYSSPLMPKSKLTNHNTLKKVKTNISIAGLTKQNEKSVVYICENICIYYLLRAYMRVYMYALCVYRILKDSRL